MTTFSATELDNKQLYGILATAIAPRPICFASTVDAEGRVNLSPYSFFNVFSSNPPILVFSPVLSGRDASRKDTLNNLHAVPEVVVNVVDYAMVQQMSLASGRYAPGVNEFVKAGVTEVASTDVRPPRVAEAPVAFECVVDRIVPLGEEGGAGNLVLARVVRVHVRDAYLDGEGNLRGEALDLVGRMGSNDYVRASGAALFEVAKPGTVPGIGVDALPAAVRNSEVLTGNDLGQLGSLPELPAAEMIRANRPATGFSLIERHERARRLIAAGRVEEALAGLLAETGD